MKSDSKVFVVSNDLCSGCRNCEIWCGFIASKRRGFAPDAGHIRLHSDPEGKLNIPEVDCPGVCERNQGGEPICVEMCPTGCLIFTNREDFERKRILWEKARQAQPVFKLIVPWKYPYPWRELRREEL
jgi:Fe-S-cluster-containing dehydrogenase component